MLRTPLAFPVLDLYSCVTVNPRSLLMPGAGSAKTETGLGLTGRPGRQRIPEVLLEAVRYPLGMQETESVPKVLLLITNMGEQLL